MILAMQLIQLHSPSARTPADNGASFEQGTVVVLSSCDLGDAWQVAWYFVLGRPVAICVAEVRPASDAWE